MDKPLRVFVSSVQKELESERLLVSNLIQTDPFLKDVTTPVLYEKEPASPNSALTECIELLDGCQVCVLIVGKEYGHLVGQLSITHYEYRHARQKPVPVLAFIKGGNEVTREPGVEGLLEELKKDDIKYKRFNDIIELQKEVRAALVKLLSDKYGVHPSPEDNETALQTIEATSGFESERPSRLRWDQLDFKVARKLVGVAEGREPETLSKDEVREGLELRGLVWHDVDTGEHYATAAGIVLLAPDPSTVYPQCRIQADAFRGKERVIVPDDQEEIRSPMPLAIDRAIEFVDRNTRHPMRVVGLNRVRLDEYPTEALREVLVNSVAHRRYEDAGRRIMIEVFSDRVVVASPGSPPPPLTIRKLQSGNYRPCSRNPVIALSLSRFHRIEERGSGFRRMKDAMLNHGLEAPNLAENSGYFQVTLPGPADDLGRLQVSDSQLLVTPAIEAKLNERQQRMVGFLAEGKQLTNRGCQKEFGVGRDTVARDFSLLKELGIARSKGRGRSTSYVLVTRD